MKSYTVAVVGCGARSSAHIDAYQFIPRARVIACCAPGRTRREAVAARYGLKAYSDAAEMIRREKPDLVHLVTWPNTRVELMTLVSDLHVPACTVEKPVAMGVGDWKKLCELESRTRTKFAVCHQLRWHRNLVRCRDALIDAGLGSLQFLDMSAGMNISGQGTHILDYAMSLNGDSPVVRIFGSASGAAGMQGGHPAPDSTVGYLTFANGVRALWNNGPTAPRCGQPDVEWQHVRVAGYAQRGSVLFEEFGKWRVTGPDRAEEGDFGGMKGWEEKNLQAQAAFHQAMLHWIEDDNSPAGTNLAQSLHEWKVVLALYASALWRRAIDMDGFDPPEDLFEQLRDTLAQRET